MLVLVKGGLYFWENRSAYRCDVDCFKKKKNLLNKLGNMQQSNLYIKIPA